MTAAEDARMTEFGKYDTLLFKSFTFVKCDAFSDIYGKTSCGRLCFAQDFDQTLTSLIHAYMRICFR